jgi:hypothetical protein
MSARRHFLAGLGLMIATSALAQVHPPPGWPDKDGPGADGYSVLK